MNTTSPKRPVDMERPTHNDIIAYEIHSVQSNKFMSPDEKKEKLEMLRGQMTATKSEEN